MKYLKNHHFKNTPLPLAEKLLGIIEKPEQGYDPIATVALLRYKLGNFHRDCEVLLSDFALKKTKAKLSPDNTTEIIATCIEVKGADGKKNNLGVIISLKEKKIFVLDPLGEKAGCFAEFKKQNPFESQYKNIFCRIIPGIEKFEVIVNKEKMEHKHSKSNDTLIHNFLYNTLRGYDLNNIKNFGQELKGLFKVTHKRLTEDEQKLAAEILNGMIEWKCFDEAMIKRIKEAEGKLKNEIHAREIADRNSGIKCCLLAVGGTITASAAVGATAYCIAKFACHSPHAVIIGLGSGLGLASIAFQVGMGLSII